MKITLKVLIQILCLTAISFYAQNMVAGTTQADDVASEQHSEVTQATAKAEVAIQNANEAIGRAREQVLDGTITAQAAGKIIIEQTVLIAQAKQELKRVISQAVQKVGIADDQEQGYLDYFVSGVKNIGANMIAPIKSRYDYTEFEKKIARKTIKGLTDQQDQLTRDYENAMNDVLTAVERTNLKDRYEAIIDQLNKEIYQQKLITGEEMSPEKKLFWVAVAGGAALLGTALLTHYSGKEVAQDMLPTATSTAVPSTAPQSDSSQVPVQPKETPTASLVAVEPEKLPESKLETTQIAPVEPAKPETPGETQSPEATTEPIKPEVVLGEPEVVSTKSVISEEAITPEEPTQTQALTKLEVSTGQTESTETEMPSATEPTTSSTAGSTEPEGLPTGSSDFESTLTQNITSAESELDEQKKDPSIIDENVAVGFKDLKDLDNDQTRLSDDGERFIDYTADQGHQEKSSDLSSDSGAMQTEVPSGTDVTDISAATSIATMSLQEQANAIGEQNATRFIELSNQVAQAQKELDEYKSSTGEDVDHEKLKILEDNLQSAQQAGANFLQKAIKEKEDFEIMAAEEQEKQRIEAEETEKVKQAGEKMIAAKQEEKELDEAVVAMEAEYNAQQERNTKLIDDGNALIASIKSGIAETIKVKQDMGDEKGVKLLQDIDQKYTNFVNTELAKGRSPQEIYDDLVGVEASLKLQMMGDRSRAASIKAQKEKEAAEKTAAETQEIEGEKGILQKINEAWQSL